MNDTFKQYRVLNEEVIHDGFFKLKRLTLKHSLYEGGWSPQIHRELLQHGDCVAVLPYDPVTDQVVLVEQFRVGAILDKPCPWLLEIVAGAVESGESPADVAMRESLEEARCEVLKLIKISEFYTSPGISSERITLYCGRIDSREVGGVAGVKSEDEDIYASVADFDLAMRKIKNGEIDSAISIVALQWLALNRDWVREIWT